MNLARSGDIDFIYIEEEDQSAEEKQLKPRNIPQAQTRTRESEFKDYLSSKSFLVANWETDPLFLIN